MKKIIVFAAALLLGLNAFAQLNVGGGYMYEYAPWRDRGEGKGTTEERHGVYAGVSYNFNITSFGLGIAPGAYFSWTGGVNRLRSGRKDIDRLDDYVARRGTRHMAVTLPVHVTYSMDLGPGTLFAYAGPAFQVGLSHKSYTNGKGIDGRFREVSDNHFGRNYDYRACDLRLGTGFGYRWRFLQAHVGVDFGLIDRAPGDLQSNHIHSIYMGAAYVF